MSTNLTRDQAEAVLREIEIYYDSWIEPGRGPRLFRNWEKTYDSPTLVAPWAIVWYEGPYGWARFTANRRNGVIDRTDMHAKADTFQVLTLHPN